MKIRTEHEIKAHSVTPTVQLKLVQIVNQDGKDAPGEFATTLEGIRIMRDELQGLANYLDGLLRSPCE